VAGGATERPAARWSRGPRVLRFLYGGGLFAIGACLGVVIGSLTETPRLLLERLRGPVETLDVAAAPEAEPGAAERAIAPLERFSELQEGKRPAPPAKRAEPVPAPAPAAPPAAAPPPVATAPPAPKPAPAPTAAPAPATVGRPVVQVASQIDRKAADDMVAKLRVQGFDAYVGKPAAQNGRFRVRVRPQAEESPAALARRLKTAGYDTWATSE
jgi:cell division septation protein DedD